MEKNRVDITICGTEYILAGEKSEEKIKEIAKYVDDEMRRTGKMLNSNPNYKVAVLAAINLSEQLMENSEMLLKIQNEKQQLDDDVKHYISLWEASKKEASDMKEKMNSDITEKDQSSEKFKDIEARCSEYENACFDLQMENVRLKNEIENLKKLRTENE